MDTKPSPTAAHFLTWLVAFILEAILLGASLTIYDNKHREPTAGTPGQGRLRRGVTHWEAVEIVVDIVRILFILALIAFYSLFVLLRKLQERRLDQAHKGNVEETTGLLNGGPEGGHSHGQSYGGIGSQSTKEETSGWIRPDTIPSKSWWEYIRGYSLFFPYLWPAKSVRLQITVVFCFFLVMVARVINVLVPVQVGIITDILSGENGDYRGIPWGPICLYIFYRVLQGGNGLLGAAGHTLDTHWSILISRIVDSFL